MDHSLTRSAMSGKRSAGSSPRAGPSKRKMSVKEPADENLVVPTAEPEPEREAEIDANESEEDLWEDYPKNFEEIRRKPNAHRQLNRTIENLTLKEMEKALLRSLLYPPYRELTPILDALQQLNITQINDPNLKTFTDYLMEQVREWREKLLLLHMTTPPTEEQYHQLCWSCHKKAPNRRSPEQPLATSDDDGVLRCSRCPRVAHDKDSCRPAVFARITSADQALVLSFNDENPYEGSRALCAVCQRREAEFTEAQVNDRFDPTFMGRNGRQQFFAVFFAKFIEQYLLKVEHPEGTEWIDLDREKSPVWSLKKLYLQTGRLPPIAGGGRPWISEPLDLSAMQEKVDQGGYHLFEEMYADLCTIAHNLSFFSQRRKGLQAEKDAIALLQQVFCDEQASASQCLGCYNNYADRDSTDNHWMKVPCYRLHKPVWYKLSPQQYKYVCEANNFSLEEGLDGRGNIYRVALMYLAPEQLVSGSPINYRIVNHRFVLKTIYDPSLNDINKHFSENDFIFERKDYESSKTREKKTYYFRLRNFSSKCPETEENLPAEVKAFQKDCAEELVIKELQDNWRGYHFMLKSLEGDSSKAIHLPSGSKVYGESCLFEQLSIPSFIRPREDWPDFYGMEEEIGEKSAYLPTMDTEDIVHLFDLCMKGYYFLPREETIPLDIYEEMTHKLLTLREALLGPFICCKYCQLTIVRTQGGIFPYCSIQCAYSQSIEAANRRKANANGNAPENGAAAPAADQ